MDPVVFLPNKIHIIEGAYSCHKSLRNYYQLKIFLTVESEVQLQRIQCRNGIEMLERFKKEWIPKEETYFKQDNIKEQCDLVFALS